MKRVVACLLLALSGAVGAQAPPSAAAVAHGEPHAEAPLRDREFGVATRQFGLQRRVEMYQWRRLGPGYRKVWEDRPIDSAAYDARYRNPAFPLQTRYWIAEGVRLDGRPLDEDVLRQLGTWRAFRPGFSALPGNLSATFQPEGDGLGSAENPLDPQIGDLRVTWRELALPALGGRVALQDGVWMPMPAAVASATQAGVVDAPPRRETDAFPVDLRMLVIAVAAGAALLLAFVLLRRRRAR